MNFVGHAVVAWRERADPAFAFGAMVPDLSRFARREEPAPSRQAAVLRDGIAAHHRADAAFHDHPLFKSWTASMAAAMPGSPRGARAAAHVAIELAIDGALLDRGEATAYGAALEWAGPSFDGVWEEVVARMRTGGIVEAYRRPDGIAARVVAVLGRRPRLAALTPEAGDVAAGIAAIVPVLEHQLDGLLRDVSEHSLM